MSSVTHDKFRELCQKHDLTYQYSDDHSVWTRGNESLSKIKAAAKQLDRADAVRIWNEVLDTKIVEGHRAPWYWEV